MKFSSFATIRGLVLPFAAASLFLVASPVAHAQVPQAQTGGSGQNDADQPPPAPAAEQPADKPTDKPADAAPAPATSGDKPAADAPADNTPAAPPPPGTVAPMTGSSTTTTATKNADGSASVSTSKTVKLPFHKKAANTTTASKTEPKKPKTASEEKDTSGGAEPDKVLYDRAQDDLKHGRYTEGRLALQTLVNTLPG